MNLTPSVNSFPLLLKSGCLCFSFIKVVAVCEAEQNLLAFRPFVSWRHNTAVLKTCTQLCTGI
jgi:hypothetical protein